MLIGWFRSYKRASSYEYVHDKKTVPLNSYPAFLFNPDGFCKGDALLCWLSSICMQTTVYLHKGETANLNLP